MEKLESEVEEGKIEGRENRVKILREGWNKGEWEREREILRKERKESVRNEGKERERRRKREAGREEKGRVTDGRKGRK